MELFFIDRGALAHLPPEARARVDPDRLREALDRAGVPDGMPFLVGDDGRPVKELNDFFRELPSLGCRSQDTWRAYALDVFRFARYLSAVEGVPPFGATVEHVERYRWMRLQGQRPVRPSTWNREVAALQRFYGWAQRRGHVTTPPFRFGSGGREGRNLARARLGDDAPIRYLTVEQYLFFRDVGLFGLGLDGRRDPSFAGEHALRNKLFADLLVTTGLRLREASLLTRVELPGPSAGAASLAIAGPTAKRSKPRDVLVPARVLDNLRFYARSARAEMVERAVRSGRLPGSGDVAVSVRGQRVVASDGSFDADLAVIDPGRRWRIVEVGDGAVDPLALFVGRSGRPVRPQAWERVFEAASHRCESFAGRPGVPTIGRVTPHMLRHTFAVHTLSALLTEQLRRCEDESPRGHPGRVALRQVAENPLRRLQRLLGHSQVATTYAYLDCLDEANELVEAALARWDTDASWADVAGDHGPMTTKGRYRNDFAASPLPPRSPSPVGARRLQVDHQGRRRTVGIDPDAFICRRLVAELAGAVAGMHEAMDLSWGALQRLAASAKNLAGYIDEAVLDPIGIRCHTLTVDVLEGWQSWLRRAHAARSDMPGERASEVFRLLRWLDEHSEVPVAAEVAARVQAPVTYPRARAGSVDEFSAAERVAIENAARRDVERLKRNLTLARCTEGPLGELIAAARAGELTAACARQRFGPRWETLPDDLRSLVDRRDPPPVILDDAARAVISEVFDLHAQGWPAAEIASTLNSSGRATRRGGPWTVHAVRHVLARRYAGVPASVEHTSRSQATRERRLRDWSPEGLVEAVHRLVWPHELDLVGVIVLLGLRTGLPPECIKDLTISCVTGSDRRFATIEYVKRRGRGRSSLRVPNQGEFAPARLVGLVLAATAETRALLAGEATKRLFVCGSRHYGILCARAADFQGTFERWCRAHHLEVAPPFDLRRLRKTRKVARALALRGSVTDIADDHTTQVAHRHYLQTATLQVLSADVIRGVQHRIIEEVTAGPVVVPPAAEATLATDARAAAAAGMKPATARAVIAGRLDVGLASCRDVRSSPFAPAGELCPAAFGGSCLWCPNAIITERSLPALLLFCDHIEDQRRDLPPPTWNERWGSTLQRIRDQILPAFPETAVSEAREAAEVDRGVLHLPATMTARSRR